MIRKEIRLGSGETRKVTNDWAAECEERGTTVAASSWNAEGLTVSGALLSSTVATALVSSLADSYGMVRNTVTLANGETLVADRYVYKS